MPEVDAIVKQLAESAAPGDVVCVLSSGSFDGLHDKLLDAIGDAMRPAQRERHGRRARAAREGRARRRAGARRSVRRRSSCCATSRASSARSRSRCYGDDAVLRALAVDAECARRRLRLDARRHGGQPGALARRAPDLSAHRERERLLRREVRLPRRRSLDAVASWSRRARRSPAVERRGPGRDAPRSLMRQTSIDARARGRARGGASCSAARAPPTIRGKGNPRDLVTEWDLRSEERDPRGARERRPGIPVLGEEGGQGGRSGGEALARRSDRRHGQLRHGLPIWSIVDRARDAARASARRRRARRRSAGGSRRRARRRRVRRARRSRCA